MIRRYLILLSLVALAPVYSRAQGAYDAYKMKADKHFSEHVEQVDADFRRLRSAFNKHFEDALRAPWEKKSVKQAEQAPRNKDKEVPPVVIKEEEKKTPPQDNQIVVEELPLTPVSITSPEPVFPIKEPPASRMKTASFTIYGTGFSVRYPGTPRIRSVDEQSVADFWAVLSGETYDYMLVDLFRQRTERSLCDWAYLKVVDKFSETLYGSVTSPEAIVLQTFILIQSGFLVYIARDVQGKLHKLVVTDRSLYGFQYLTVNGQKCYLVDGGGNSSFYVMDKTPEKTSPLSLSMIKEISFEVAESESRELRSKSSPAVMATVSINRNLIDFYSEYPESYVNNDSRTRLHFYANTPLSSLAQKSLYPSLKQAISGKDDAEAVGLLLNFVQTAFVYEYDSVVWGRDRAFFSDETLFYPYCDCEDRSILLSRLVRDLTGRSVVLILYPRHLAIAVNFSSDVSGDYVVVDGRKYVICDPTYIGAPVGYTMPDMDNSRAKVIRL